jgi:hypothetical protein
MKKLYILVPIVLVALIAASLYAGTANAVSVPTPVGGIGTGTIRIWPHGSYYPLPIMLTTPATFGTNTTNNQKAYCPNVVLVMTNASYQGLTGPVTVTWTGGSTSFPKSSFTSVILNSANVPPSGTTRGGRYKVSTLQEHIGVNNTADQWLWYVYGPFLSKPINGTIQTFTVTLPSTHPRMLVLIIGKSQCSTGCRIQCVPEFDMKVPPTQPGFVVPDAAPALIALSSFSALGLYAVKRRKK